MALIYGELRFQGGRKIKGLAAKILGLLALLASTTPLLVLAGVLPANFDSALQCGTFAVILMAGVMFGRYDLQHAYGVQTSVVSAFVGITIGSLIGAFLERPPSTMDPVELGRVVLTSTTLAGITVILLPRRPVENLWLQIFAGIFIGVWVGYFGEIAVATSLEGLK